MKFGLLTPLAVSLAFYCVSTSLLADVEIYKETDATGKVIYTDKPKSQSAEKVEVNDINTIPKPVNNQDLANQNRTSQVPNGQEDTPPEFKSIKNYQATITFPSQNHVAFVAGQDFVVKTSVQPQLDRGFKLLLQHNGQISQGLVIKKILPGSHSIVVLVADEEGSIVSKSSPVKFTVKLRRIDKRRYQP